MHIFRNRIVSTSILRDTNIQLSKNHSTLIEQVSKTQTLNKHLLSFARIRYSNNRHSVRMHVLLVQICTESSHESSHCDVIVSICAGNLGRVPMYISIFNYPGKHGRWHQWISKRRSLGQCLSSRWVLFDQCRLFDYFNQIDFFVGWSD